MFKNLFNPWVEFSTSDRAYLVLRVRKKSITSVGKMQSNNGEITSITFDGRQVYVQGSYESIIKKVS